MTPAHNLFGFPIAALSMADVVDRCGRTIRDRESLQIGVVNAAKIVNSEASPDLRDAVLSCDLILADGQSVVWASRILRRPLPERLAGIDLFLRLLQLADDDGLSVYLLGGTDAVVEATVRTIGERFPNARVVGSRDGYFSEDESAGVAAGIAAARPDMLFLGMTSPKKEIFLARHGEAMNVPVTHGVGGSFDVLSGVTRRAPEAWQRLGMEWAYRLAQEPGRLWRRYLVTNTRFVWLVLLEATSTRRRAPVPNTST